MDVQNPIVWIALGLLVLLGIGVFVASYLSPEARIERRRRKNNARIVSKANRPTVKFSVRTGKPKE